MADMRTQMPQVAAWVDELRQVFGREVIDGQIRNGMAGRCVFWARETGPDGQVRTVGNVPASAPEKNGGRGRHEA